jgi:hypothetical protein
MKRMTDPVAATTRPFLTIYVAWHPSFEDGKEIALALFQHYRRDLYRNVAGGSGLPVIYRSQPPEGEAVPVDIDMEGAEATAIVMLVDEHWTGDSAWVEWGRKVSAAADETGLRALVFPVAIDGSGIAEGVILEQAVRWDKWTEDGQPVKLRRLFTALSYEFCRMTRRYLERPDLAEDDLSAFLRKVEVFLSHSKHDEDGIEIAQQFRKYVQNAGYDAFFDVFNIPIGLRFNRVLLEKVRVSAVVAIHTDSYSTREWCRREMIEAKSYNVPLVVANCIKDLDERGFPYMANVPIVRMDPEKKDRIEVVVARLMDEVLKDFLWRCRVKLFAGGEDIAFLPRPPELIVLTALKRLHPEKNTLVYPDPPIGAEEMELFAHAAPGVKLLSTTEWVAGAAP